MLLAFPAVSPAPPPVGCGFIAIEDTRYEVKADRIPCDTARKWVRRFIKGKGGPAGYQCDPVSSGTAVAAHCRMGHKDFFAIRH